LKTLLLLLCLTLTGCATTPQQLTVEHIKEQDYKVTGHLDREEYEEIIRIVRANWGKPINFYATSHGGSSDDLFECMDTLYAHGQVHWYSVSHCNSACAILALSTRHGHGDFKMHSFYRRHHHYVETATRYNELTLEKLEHYGYDVGFLSHMFHSPEELWDLHLEDGVIVE